MKSQMICKHVHVSTYHDFTDARVPSLGIPPVVWTKQCHSEFPIIVSFLQPTFSGGSSPWSRNPLCLPKSTVWTRICWERKSLAITLVYFVNNNNNSTNNSNSNIDINNDNNNAGGSSPSSRNPLASQSPWLGLGCLERKSIAITLVYVI